MSAAVVAMPDYSLQVGGRPCPVSTLDRLSAVVLSQVANRSACCRLTLRLDTDAADLVAAFPLGAELVLRIDETPLFSGTITAQEEDYAAEQTSWLVVQAYDRLQVLADRQPVRVFAQTDSQSVLEELAATAGVTLVAPGTGPRFERLYQVHRSDLDLLVELCWRSGWSCHQHRETLLVFDASGTGPPLRLTHGQNLRALRTISNARALPTDITVQSWSPRAVETGSVMTDSPRVAAVGAAGGRTVTGLASDGSAQTTAWAQGELDRRHQQAERCELVCAGDPALHPGAVVELIGLTTPRRYTLTEVIHRIDAAGGYRCEASSAAPDVPALERGALVTIGEVTAVADPAGQGRVQVALPAYGSLPSEWLPVVMPGAGAGKGLVALPATGDSVLVLACGHDLAQAVVLGGLYRHGQAPADCGVSGGATTGFHFMTPGGQSLHLDDAADTVAVQSCQGHRLSLEPGGVTVHSTGSLTLEAPGNTVTIRGNHVDFKRG
jgi:phage baseplate assembly protein gpV/phage protein D